MKYSSLKPSDSCSVYFDECDRKEILGQPKYGICDLIVWGLVCVLWVISLPVTWCCSFKIIPQYERAMVFRLGRVLPLKGPGLISIIPIVDRWKKIDMRMRAFKVPPQEIITIDRGVIKVGGDVQYRIVDPITAHTSIKDLNHSLRVSGHTALNTQLCYEKLVNIQNEKHYLQLRLQNQMNKAVSEWGIEIARFELTHIVVIKGAGGTNPNQDESQEDATATIMNLIKGLTSPSSSSSLHMPGLMPPGVGGILPQSMMPPSLNPMNTKPSPKTAQIELLSPFDLFCVVKGIINDEMCAQIKAIYEFHVMDSYSTEVKIWTVDLKNAPGSVIMGPSSGPADVKFQLQDTDFQKMFYAQLSPTDAYMRGQLIIDGSLQTAMKLEILVSKMKGK